MDVAIVSNNNEIRKSHRERNLGYDVNQNDVTLYDVTLWRSFLYRMCEKDVP